MKTKMKFGISISTYKRDDGKSKDYLTRALKSIKDQTYDNYHVYLIGDKYEDHDELMEISKIIDENKISVINLETAVEREKYKGQDLWYCGGTNSMNIGLNLVRDNLSCDVYCRLDHDDYWDKFHLDNLNDKYMDSDYLFIGTNAHFLNNRTYPNIFGEHLIKCSIVVHSAISFKPREIPLDYRNMIELGKRYPSDGDLLDRIGNFLSENNKKGYIILRPTVYHLEEGLAR